MNRHHLWSWIRMGGTRSAGFLAISVASVLAAETCPTQAPTVDTTYATDGTWKRSTGYGYHLFHDGSGTASMAVYDSGAAFKGQWNNAGDFLAEVGLVWNNTRTYDQYGTISADFAFTKSGTNVPYSYIGIHGYSSVANIEYYIVEDWFGSAPAVSGMTLKGTVSLDGGTYKIYKYDRSGQPSIIENPPPDQFFSIRQTPRQCGHVSVSEHFRKWDSLGMALGKLYDVRILAEAGGGSGSVDFTTASVVEAQSPTSLRRLPPEPTPVGWTGGRWGTYSLLSPTGAVLHSWKQGAASPVAAATGILPRGLYLVRFQADAGGVEMGKILVP